MADIPIAVDPGSISITGAAPNVGTISMIGQGSLPMLVVTGHVNNLYLPMLAMEATAVSGNVASAGFANLPPLTSEGTIRSGSVYSGSMSLPVITLVADFGAAANVYLPRLTASGTILSGQRAVASVSLPRIAASGAIRSDGLLSADVNLPALTMSVDVLAGRAMEASITLKKLVLAATGLSGTVSTASISLPVFTLDGDIYGEYLFQANIELPMLQLVATMPAQTGITENTTVFAMNAKTAALSNYDNFDFNSMARFNGVDLMANSSGIFAISGNLDGSAIIDAYARLGVTDFGISNHKRVEDAYIGYRADGEMRLKLIVDEHHEYEYQVYPRNYDDIHGNRLKLGRGAKGTYWQTEVGNVDGSDFEIDFLQLVAQPLARKV